MAWYYVQNGASVGPVEAEQLEALRGQNVVTADTPVWTTGMAEWLPFERSALAIVGGAPAPGIHACTECGRVFPESEMLGYEGKWVCAACKPIFFQRLREGVAPIGTLDYASVGRRWGAIVIDWLVLVVVLVVPIMITSFMIAASARGGANSTPNLPAWFSPLIMVLAYGFPAAYEIFFIGKYGATPGKMAMGVRVTDAQGNRITYGRATGRYFAKLLSRIIIYIGYLLAIWDEEKRTLHDRICETRVIRLPA